MLKRDVWVYGCGVVEDIRYQELVLELLCIVQGEREYVNGLLKTSRSLQRVVVIQHSFMLVAAE